MLSHWVSLPTPGGMEPFQTEVVCQGTREEEVRGGHDEYLHTMTSALVGGVVIFFFNGPRWTEETSLFQKLDVMFFLHLL